jgi:hypothetical protein
LRKGAEGSVATPDGLMFMVLGLLVSGVAFQHSWPNKKPCHLIGEQGWENGFLWILSYLLTPGLSGPALDSWARSWMEQRLNTKPPTDPLRRVPDCGTDVAGQIDLFMFMQVRIERIGLVAQRRGYSKCYFVSRAPSWPTPGVEPTNRAVCRLRR